ncbi:hypothetical protein BGW80DRAFT_1468844 [Lactifluus volemus]|nr:hypothetical protein BGW80DRAFT_1468844 [Lactifluus volemus]
MARRRSASGGQDDLPTDFSIVPKDHRQHPTAASADLAILSGAAEQLRSTCPHLPLSRDAASAPPAALCSGQHSPACPRITLHRQTIATTTTSTQKRKPTHQRQPVNGRRKNIKRAEATKPITSWKQTHHKTSPSRLLNIPPSVSQFLNQFLQNCSSNSSLYLIPTCKLRSDAPSFPLTPTPGVPTQPTENTSLAPPSPLPLLSVSDSYRITSTGSPLDQPPITLFASLALGWGKVWWLGCQRRTDMSTTNFLRRITVNKLVGVQASDRSVKDKEIGVLPAFTVTVDDPQNLKVGDIRGFAVYSTTYSITSLPSFQFLLTVALIALFHGMNIHFRGNSGLPFRLVCTSGHSPSEGAWQA